MSEQYTALRGNVNLLGQLLGQTIKDAQGQAILDKVEEIRALSKSSRSGNEDARLQVAPAYPLRRIGPNQQPSYRHL